MMVMSCKISTILLDQPQINSHTHAMVDSVSKLKNTDEQETERGQVLATR